MTGPNWKLENDYKTVTVTFPTNPPVALQLDANAVEDMLRNLGRFRGSMKPEVPSTYAMGQKVIATNNPTWVTEPDALLGNSLLHVRDPHYGWLHYLIPREESKKLATFLQRQVETPEPGLGQSKAN